VNLADNSHDMLSFLKSMPSNPEPFVVLDLLSMFFDPFVHIDERKRMLGLCLGHLDRLAKESGGLVSVHLPSVLSQAEKELLEMVTIAANHTYHVNIATEAPISVKLV